MNQFIALGLSFFVIDPLTGAMYTLPSQVHAVLARADGTGAATYPPLPPTYPPCILFPHLVKWGSVGSEQNGASRREKPCAIEGGGYELLAQSVPEVLDILIASE